MTDEPTKRIDEPTQPLPPRRGGSFVRRVFWTLLTVALIGAMLFGLSVAKILPEFKNPFAERVIDNSQPPILLSIKDLARFVAAEGTFEVVIDLKKDRKYVPDWLLNQRTLFVASGTVEAYVDFADLTQEKIKESPDHKTVEIMLPSPKLGEPRLDLERSYVFAEEQGLFNKVGEFFGGDPNRQRETLLVAEQRMASAAAASVLLQRAQDNTRKTLDSMLHSLGYTTVTVTFG